MAIIKKFRIKSFKKKNTILKLQNISLSFEKRLILENISFEINQGEIFGMLGPNGVGKSTIFNLVTGLIKPNSGEIIIKQNNIIDEAVCEKIDAAGVKIINVYSVITCSSREGVCARCYGRDLSRGKIVHVGEAIGMISAQSIGEPGTQLTMRTFHVGGTASIKQESQIVTKTDGILKIINTNLFEDSKKILLLWEEILNYP